MELCFFGVKLKDECHKTSYVRTTTLRKLNEFSEDERRVLLWRAGLREQNINDENLTICHHHQAKLGSIFETKFTKCCDLFEVHTKNVKGGRKIPLDLAEKLLQKGYECTPGWQFCKRCHSKAEYLVEKSEEFVRPLDDDLTEMDIDLRKTQSRHQLNENLGSIGISPINTHAMPKHRKLAYASEKLERAVGTFEDSFAEAVGVDKKTLAKRGESSTATAEEIQKKADDLDRLTEQLRQKVLCEETPYQQIIQILTLTPESWTIKYASNYFEVSEYAVRQARELKTTSGILSLPEKKTGKPTTEDIIKRVVDFYEDDEHSRLMPGKKDFISIRRNVHKQKRLLLCNLEELYALFKEKNHQMKVGFSKFCSLRPKWCVTVGSSGTHSVCVCTIHQNAILLVEGSKCAQTYKEMIAMVVCDPSNRLCMVHRCEKCPGSTPLRVYLETMLNDETEVTFQQWQSTDRSTLVTQNTSVHEFVELLLKSIDSLTAHSYIAKCQARYLKQRKDELPENCAIVLGDFAENYTFVVQDEIQSFHWSKLYCTLHPVALYYKENQNLTQKSICFLSDDLQHDTEFVHEVQREIVQFVKRFNPGITKLEYFSDGCAAQYKNYKNMLNLCHHESDFGLKANWTFFATSHGKSPCDGIGGTVKRLTARESLQRPYGDQILNVSSMLAFCEKNIRGITFSYISKERMTQVREELKPRFEKGRTIPGTRSFHYFEPVSTNVIAYKRTAEDDSFTATYNITGEEDIQEILSLKSLKIGDYVACRYEGHWWIGLVMETCDKEQDVKITFLHPRGPSKIFSWPRRSDICWIPLTEIICIVETPLSASRRTYAISQCDFNTINEKFDER